MKKWYTIIFCTQWYGIDPEHDQEYTMDEVKIQKENIRQAQKWFNEFKEDFEDVYAAKILASKCTEE